MAHFVEILSPNPNRLINPMLAVWCPLIGFGVIILSVGIKATVESVRRRATKIGVYVIVLIVTLIGLVVPALACWQIWFLFTT